MAPIAQNGVFICAIGEISGRKRQALRKQDGWRIGNPRYSAARQSRNQNGARVVSTRSGGDESGRAAVWDKPRSGKFARPATIPSDTDRLEVCATTVRFMAGEQVRTEQAALHDPWRPPSLAASKPGLPAGRQDAALTGRHDACLYERYGLRPGVKQLDQRAGSEIGAPVARFMVPMRVSGSVEAPWNQPRRFG